MPLQRPYEHIKRDRAFISKRGAQGFLTQERERYSLENAAFEALSR
jgi:hypothetical protein